MAVPFFDHNFTFDNLLTSDGYQIFSYLLIMDEFILYESVTPVIHVLIIASFTTEGLIVEGYDCGEQVKETWGDADYEYSATVSYDSLPLLYTSLAVPSGNRSELLVRLKELFHSNSAFSDFCGYLNDRGIAFTGFSWT